MIGLRLLASAAVLVATCLLAAPAANGANRTQTGEAEVPGTPTIELPESAPDAAIESSATGLETANAAIEAARERAAERELPAPANDHPVRALPEVLGAKSVDARGMPETLPGWGCGDPDRTHSGPPGRPEADPPTGCTR